MRSVEIFRASVDQINSSTCRYWVDPWDDEIQQQMFCTDRFPCPEMGIKAENFRQIFVERKKSYYVPTKTKYPYCSELKTD